MNETNQRLIASFAKNSEEEVQINFVEWKGQTYVDIRIWFNPQPGEAGGLHPSTKGLRFSSELLGDLKKAVDTAIQALDGGVEIVQGQGVEKA